MDKIAIKIATFSIARPSKIDPNRVKFTQTLIFGLKIYHLATLRHRF
jgi:hypothetical protein